MSPDPSISHMMENLRHLRALQAFDGVVEQASESELSEASAAADRAGSYTCPHTGVALAALEKLRAKADKATHRVFTHFPQK